MKAYTVIALTQNQGIAEVKSVAMDTHFGLQGVEDQAVLLSLTSQMQLWLEGDAAGHNSHLCLYVCCCCITLLQFTKE